MFWKKRVEEEAFIEEEAVELPFSPAEEMRRAVKTDREYIDIQMESLSIDVIEMMHFFNELPSLLPPSLINKNEQAIDFFRDFTGVYVGSVFEFYQTVVLFYYKNWHNPDFPFEGSQLEFVFSKVAQNLSENLTLCLQQEHEALQEIVEVNPKAFYFHEDHVEIHSNRFMRAMITFIPQFEYTEFYNPIECEFVTLANEIYSDVRDQLYSMNQDEFSSYERIYELLEHNRAMLVTPDLLQVRAMYYYPIKHVEIIRALQNVRLYRMQQVLIQGLKYDLSVQIKNIKTVGMLYDYLLNENEQLYSQNKMVHLENKRFLNLFFEHYFFEHSINEIKDSPRVRSCLNDLIQQVKYAMINEGFIGELEIIIRKAYYEHKLLVGN